MESKTQRYRRRKRHFSSLVSTSTTSPLQIKESEDEDLSDVELVHETINLSDVDMINDSDINSEISTDTDHEDDDIDTDGRVFDPDKPIFPDSNLTVGQSVLLISKFLMKNRLKFSLLHELIPLLKQHSVPENLIISSKYHYDRIMCELKAEKKLESKYHRYCKVCCSVYSDGSEKCNQCHTVKTRDAPYIVEYPIDEEIRIVMEKNCEQIINRRNIVPNYYFDIKDGKEYRNLQLDTHDITLLVNVDAFPLFSTSNYSITPITMCINELNPSVRFQNIIVQGIWHGSKIDTVAFLNVFVDKWKKLETCGIEWYDNRSRFMRRSRVYIIVCSVDAPMRASLQGINQFNGYFGCNLCEERGERVGHTMTYPFHEDMSPDRDPFNLLITAEQVENRTVAAQFDSKGVQRLCIFRTLSNFNIVHSFTPDYLHCVLLGVVRRLISLWLDSNNRGQSWYIGRDLNAMDNVLYSIRIPTDMRRTYRSLNTRKYWRGSEYRSFLLYFGPIVLRNVLHNDYYNHFLIFSNSIYRLLKDKLNNLDIFHSEVELEIFCQYNQLLYGASNMTWNCHQLRHMCKSVTKWGPLWCWSNRGFESFLGLLKKSVTGSQAVPYQLSSRILDSYFIKANVDEVEFQRKGLVHSSGGYICDKLVKFNHSRLKQRYVRRFNRYFNNSTLFIASTERSSKRSGSMITFCDGEEVKYGDIQAFYLTSDCLCNEPCLTHSHIMATIKVYDDEGPIPFMPSVTLETKCFQGSEHLRVVRPIEDDQLIIASTIQRQCVRIDNVDGIGTVVGLLPNLFERNF